MRFRNYGCRACEGTVSGCGEAHWRVRADTISRLVPAPSAQAAKYRVFKALREAGYFAGRWGFRDFVHMLPTAYQVRP